MGNSLTSNGNIVDVDESRNGGGGILDFDETRSHSGRTESSTYRPIPASTPTTTAATSSVTDAPLCGSTTPAPLLTYSRRPNLGQHGYPILLRANHFQITMAHDHVHRYDVNIAPDNCPRQFNREIIETMVAQYRSVFGVLKPVFDGKNNLYTRDELSIGKDFLNLEVILSGNRVFRVSIKWVAQVSLLNLEEESGGRATHNSSGNYDAVQVLEVVMRHLPSMVHTRFGRSFYNITDGRSPPLEGGRELRFGYHQSVRPTQLNMMLNMDASASVFYKVQPVTDFLCEVLGIRTILEQTKPLSDSQRARFTREIKDLKIEVTHRGRIRRYRVCDVPRRPVAIQSFTWRLKNGQTVECTVAKYFLERYKIEVKHPHLQCLQVAPENIYLPLEVCTIAAGQICNKKLTDMQTSTMIKETVRPAPDRELAINNLVERADFNNDEYLREFGLTISNSMMEISGRVLPPPRVQYNGGDVVPRDSIWDMRGRKLYTGVEIRVWAIACFAPLRTVREDDLKKFNQQLQKVSGDVGMPIHGLPCFCKYATGADQVEPMFRYLKKSFDGLQLVVVVLPGKTPVYAEVKRVGDTVLGLATQCIQARHVVKPFERMLSHLCLKINVKLGGINSILEPLCRPSVFNDRVIFLGADVTHPPVKNNNKPSIAAVVASIDTYPARYAATVRIQPHCQEIIEELSSMVHEVLLMFFQSTGGNKPKRIIFYRDGLPESQFPQVLKHELAALYEACAKLEHGYQPAITLIVVEKRHKTRLFCADKNQGIGRLGNIPPGTIVDGGITHPTRFNFYLCSHQGTMGTSRPALYHVLWDDNEFDFDELQRLTYQLCYTYARCTRSISIPAPVYYAHLAAFRARFHLVEIEHDCGSVKSECSERTPEEMARAITVHSHSKDVMYFA